MVSEAGECPPPSFSFDHRHRSPSSFLDPPRSGSVPISGLADSSAPKANSYDLRKEALWPTVPAAAIGRVHGQRNNSRFERGSASPAGALRKSCDDERKGSQRASRGRWRRSTHERDEQRPHWSAVSLRRSSGSDDGRCGGPAGDHEAFTDKDSQDKSNGRFPIRF